MENVSLDDQKTLDEARSPIIAGPIYLMDRTPKSKFIAKLEGGNYYVRVGVLRNPGGMLYMLLGGDGLPLSQTERSRLAALAKGAGVEVLENGRIPYRFGPDGRTPVIMPSILEYSPEKYAAIVPMSVEMTFKSVETARAAIDYIDQKRYVTKVSGLKLHISFKSQLGAATDEREAFESLAHRFDGKVEWLETKSTE